MVLIFDKNLINAKNYWIEKLTGKTVKSGLPVRIGDNTDEGFVPNEIEFTLKDSLVEKINDLSGGSSFLKYVIVMTAVKICLFKYNNTEFVTVGSPSRKGKTSNSQGNVLVIMDRITNQMTCKELMVNVRQSLLDAYDNQQYPFNLLINELNIEYSKYDNPLYSVLISMNNIHLDLPDFASKNLTIQLDDSDVFTGVVEYNSLMFSRDIITQFVNHINLMLEQMLSNINSVINELPEISFNINYDNQEKAEERVDLQYIQNAIKESPLIQDAIIQLNKGGGIVAYLLSKPNQVRSNHLLKSYLLKRLPEEMIPVEFIWIDDEIDLLNSDFLNEVTQTDSKKNKIPPRNEIEEKISKIWSSVLYIENIGVFDNFFEIGGDSILSIQTYSEMKKAGFTLSPKDIISHPTIAELSQIVKEGVNLNTEQEKKSGIAPLTPPQLRFFEKELHNYHHFNNSWIFKVNIKLNPNIVEKTLKFISNHHDALRLFFKKTSDGWKQYFSDTEHTIAFSYYDWSDVDIKHQKKKIEDLANYHQTLLDINNGPLLRVVLISLGGNVPDRLLIISHRLISDTITMKIFAEDFQLVYSQLLNGKNPSFPEKTTSYYDWTNKLIEYANTDIDISEKKYWQSDIFNKPFYIPIDFEEGENTELNTELLFASLNQKDTESLLSKVHRDLRVDMRVVSFTALLMTINKWTGNKHILVETGSHGREVISNNIDLSRTAGWFTTNYPVYLELYDQDKDIIQTIQSVKNQLSNIPNNGFNYGLLRYLHDDQDIKQKLSKFPKPIIGFDYQGHVDSGLNRDLLLTPSDESVGNERDPRNKRNVEFDISSWVSNKKYILRWSYSNKRYKKSTVEQLIKYYIDTLKEIIDS
ncbi:MULTISPECIES: condensation domain-containing protein [Anoxybacillaceae]|jgi:non-ribosomal peptide synthase protein (TIGR01720 family)|uniref:condensation domain-containing protein n=1 Tax=Anoxybacillaceae TaxID=3120669 RepID=UPI001318930D|nr:MULTISPECIES: condensation domain-containing protein [Anoxybacillus]MBS2773079.1 hypothetical protein [Anoxybacillus rupiensis]QHC02999.1 hypothetical protein GRQ40_02700 [Anoxybacillus sp. PDR2]